MEKNTSDTTMKNVKAQAFDWVFKALIGVVLWLVADMHQDLKGVLQIIPVLRTQIDYLQDGLLKSRFQAIPPAPAAKHEDNITLDSLIQQ